MLQHVEFVLRAVSAMAVDAKAVVAMALTACTHRGAAGGKLTETCQCAMRLSDIFAYVVCVWAGHML